MEKADRDGWSPVRTAIAGLVMSWPFDLSMSVLIALNLILVIFDVDTTAIGSACAGDSFRSPAASQQCPGSGRERKPCFAEAELFSEVVCVCPSAESWPSGTRHERPCLDDPSLEGPLDDPLPVARMWAITHNTHPSLGPSNFIASSGALAHIVRVFLAEPSLALYGFVLRDVVLAEPMAVHSSGIFDMRRWSSWLLGAACARLKIARRQTLWSPIAQLAIGELVLARGPERCAHGSRLEAIWSRWASAPRRS